MNVLPLLDAYLRASRRLLLLDYDGTLIEFNKNPMAAKPNRQLLDVLHRLSSDPANTVVVISGRSGTTLQDWLGHLPLGFSAEHGFVHKKPGATWELIAHRDDEWKAAVRRLMQYHTDMVPGSILEEKLNALSWHWRAAKDLTAAAQAEQRLLVELEKVAEPMQLRVLRIIRGNKVIEVHPAGYDKGTGTKYWLDQRVYDFMLAAGDDTTDEDMFRVMPEGSFIIKVGADDAGAGRLLLDSPAAMRKLLEKLASHAGRRRFSSTTKSTTT